MSETTRAIVKLATTTADLPEKVTATQLDAALEDLKSRQPLKTFEPGLDGQISRLVENSLRPIGAAIDPRLSPEASKAWRKALLLKLSNLPSSIVLKATREAVHVSFRFFDAVEPEIRKIAESLIKQQRVAIMRLERWRAEVERAANPLPALPPQEDVRPEEVDDLNATFERLGMKTRFRVEGDEVVIEPPNSENRARPE